MESAGRPTGSPRAGRFVDERERVNTTADKTEAVPPPAPPEGAGHGVAQEIKWGDFRDHLATADQQGRRRWLFPKQPKGRLYRIRTWFSWLLIGIMFAGPFIKMNCANCHGDFITRCGVERLRVFAMVRASSKFTIFPSLACTAGL